jgi:hypothetical protein
VHVKRERKERRAGGREREREMVYIGQQFLVIFL